MWWVMSKESSMLGIVFVVVIFFFITSSVVFLYGFEYSDTEWSSPDGRDVEVGDEIVIDMELWSVKFLGSEHQYGPKLIVREIKEDGSVVGANAVWQGDYYFDKEEWLSKSESEKENWRDNNPSVYLWTDSVSNENVDSPLRGVVFWSGSVRWTVPSHLEAGRYRIEAFVGETKDEYEFDIVE